MLQILLTLRQALCSWRNNEARLTATFQFGINSSNNYVHVGNATVGDPCLCSVQHPLIICFVVDSTGAQVGHVATCIWFAHTKCAELHIVWSSVTLWNPFHHLLRCSVTCNTCCSKTRTHDGHTDTSITPEHFFNCHHHGETTWVCHCVHDEVKAVQTDFCGFLYYWPRELFLFIPFMCSRANGVNGELVDPVL